MKEIFTKFISTGFGEENKNSSPHMRQLYAHNYGEFLPKDKSARILDIGSGTGSFLEFLGAQGYENFIGVDLSEEAVRFCKEKGIEKIKLIDNLSDFLNTAEPYDLIVMNDVIEHLEREQILPILHKIREKLSADGKLIVKTGNMASLVGLRIRYNDFTHTCGFTEYSLTQVLKTCSFSDIDIYPFVFPLNRFRRIVRAFCQRILHALWRFVFFLEFCRPAKILNEIIFAVARR